MIKNLIKIILILIIYLASCYYIYKADKLEEVNDINNNDINQNIIVNRKIKENKKIEYNSNIKDDSIGQIIIKKININRKLYNIDNPKNNIEENITILKGSIEPDKVDSIIFVAAHSGYGEKAFFKNLDKLESKDQIIIKYNNIDYRYEVKNKWETNKDGDIEVEKEDKKQLILTTCSPTDKTKQLIINCIEKES